MLFSITGLVMAVLGCIVLASVIVSSHLDKIKTSEIAFQRMEQEEKLQESLKKWVLINSYI